MRNAVAIALVSLGLAAPALAGDGPIAVKAGVATIVLSFASFNPDTCGYGPLPIMKIARPPSHGTVTFEKYQHVIRENSCAGHTLRSMATVYRSAPGYRGPDTFAVDAETELFVNEPGMRTSRNEISVLVK